MTNQVTPKALLSMLEKAEFLCHSCLQTLEYMLYHNADPFADTPPDWILNLECRACRTAVLTHPIAIAGRTLAGLDGNIRADVVDHIITHLTRSHLEYWQKREGV